MKKIIPLNNPDLFLSAKNELEKQYTDNTNESISAFIESLNLNNSIFIKDDIVIPFAIIEDYVFYTPVSIDTDNYFLEELKSINYNLNALKCISFDDVLTNKLDNYNYFFIINDNYFVKNM